MRLFMTTHQSVPLSITLRNLTLSNGHAADSGGAIFLSAQDAATPTTLDVDHVTFLGNTCDAQGPDVGGGAIHAEPGNILNVSNSLFTENVAGNGGAIGQIQGQISITKTTFRRNYTHPETPAGTGGKGAGLYLRGSSPGASTIEGSDFDDNFAYNLGGAIHSSLSGVPSELIIVETTLNRNGSYRRGGALFHTNGGLTITASTFSGNVATEQGGGLWVADEGEGTPVVITNSTFASNFAGGGPGASGGAITNGGASSLTLLHATIAGNGATGFGAGIVSGAANTTLKSSIVANNFTYSFTSQQGCTSTLGDGGGNIQWPAPKPGDPYDRPCAASVAFADPKLGELAANGGPTLTMALEPGSAALDAAVGCPPPVADQRGVARPQLGACDVGAFESKPFADLSITKAAERPSPAPGQPIRDTIVAKNNGPWAASGARVLDTLPTSLTDANWTCVASAGSSCQPSGSGSLDQTANLAAGGTATYTVEATVAPTATRLVANTAAISVPDTMEVDTNPANNVSTVVTPLARPMSFYTVAPCRVVDTRGPTGSFGGPRLATGQSRSFPAVGQCGIPDTAWALSVNVTVPLTFDLASVFGNLRLYPGGTPVPATSTLNYARAYGQLGTRANNAVVLLGPGGDIAVFCEQTYYDGVDFVLDVNGYFE